MGIQSIVQSTETLAGATPSFITAAEIALLSRTDLTMFFDAKGFVGSSEVSSNNRITEWRSRKLQGGLQPKFIAPSEAFGIYCSVAPTGVRNEMRFGIDMSDAVIGGSNNRSMTGNAYAALPSSGDFTWFAMIRIKVPAANSIIASTQDTTDQWAVSLTSGQLLRSYHNYSALQIPSTSTVDTAYHLLSIRYDRGSNLTTMYRDSTVIKVATAQTLPAYPDYKLNLGYVTSGASVDTNSGFAMQMWGMITAIDDVTLNLVRAVLTERPA